MAVIPVDMVPKSWFTAMLSSNNLLSQLPWICSGGGGAQMPYSDEPREVAAYGDHIGSSLRYIRPTAWCRAYYNAPKHEHQLFNPSTRADIIHNGHVALTARPVWLPTILELDVAKRTNVFPESVSRYDPLPQSIHTTTHMAFDGTGRVVLSTGMDSWPSRGGVGVFVRFDDALDKDQIIWMILKSDDTSPLMLKWYGDDSKLVLRMPGLASVSNREMITPGRPYFIYGSWNRGTLSLTVCDLLQGTLSSVPVLYEENTPRRGRLNGEIVLGGGSTRIPDVSQGFEGVAGDPFLDQVGLSTSDIAALTGCKGGKIDEVPHYEPESSRISLLP